MPFIEKSKPALNLLVPMRIIHLWVFYVQDPPTAKFWCNLTSQMSDWVNESLDARNWIYWMVACLQLPSCPVPTSCAWEGIRPSSFPNPRLFVSQGTSLGRVHHQKHHQSILYGGGGCVKNLTLGSDEYTLFTKRKIEHSLWLTPYFTDVMVVFCTFPGTRQVVDWMSLPWCVKFVLHMITSHRCNNGSWR